MKELTLQRIFDRKIPSLTSLSINVNGVWSFITINNLLEQGGCIPRTDSVTKRVYFLMNYDFAFLPATQTNPEKGLEFGDKGDFITVNAFGELTKLNPSLIPIVFPNQKKGLKATTQIVNYTPDNKAYAAYMNARYRLPKERFTAVINHKIIKKSRFGGLVSGIVGTILGGPVGAGLLNASFKTSKNTKIRYRTEEIPEKYLKKRAGIDSNTKKIPEQGANYGLKPNQAFDANLLAQPSKKPCSCN